MALYHEVEALLFCAKNNKPIEVKKLLQTLVGLIKAFNDSNYMHQQAKHLFTYLKLSQAFEGCIPEAFKKCEHNIVYRLNSEYAPIMKFKPVERELLAKSMKQEQEKENLTPENLRVLKLNM